MAAFPYMQQILRSRSNTRDDLFNPTFHILNQQTELLQRWVFNLCRLGRAGNIVLVSEHFQSHQNDSYEHFLIRHHCGITKSNPSCSPLTLNQNGATRVPGNGTPADDGTCGASGRGFLKEFLNIFIILGKETCFYLRRFSALLPVSSEKSTAVLDFKLDSWNCYLTVTNCCLHEVLMTRGIVIFPETLFTN